MMDLERLLKHNSEEAERLRHIPAGNGLSPDLVRLNAKAHAIDTVGVLFQENLTGVTKETLPKALSRLHRFVDILIEAADNVLIEVEDEDAKEASFRTLTAKGHKEGYQSSLKYLSEELHRIR